MPEYLAPGVFVEEVERGSKAIEGVSTSTAAMVGVTERGPVNRPIFLSSFAEYRRWFGGYLNPVSSPANQWCLPSAVEGFFANGGKRLFVTRVVGKDNEDASGAIFRTNGTGTILLGAPMNLADPTAPLSKRFLPVLESVADAGEQLKVGGENAIIATHVSVHQAVVFLKDPVRWQPKTVVCVTQTVRCELDGGFVADAIEIKLTAPSEQPNTGDYLRFDGTIRKITKWDSSNSTATIDAAFGKVGPNSGQVDLLPKVVAKHLSKLREGDKIICFDAADLLPRVLGVVVEKDDATCPYELLSRIEIRSARGLELKSSRNLKWFSSADPRIDNVTVTDGQLTFPKDVQKVGSHLVLEYVSDSGVQHRELVEVSKPDTEKKTVQMKQAVRATGDVGVFVVHEIQEEIVQRDDVVGFLYESTIGDKKVWVADDDGRAHPVPPATPVAIQVNFGDSIGVGSFSVGSEVVPVDKVLTVRALDVGTWGNRLRIRTEARGQRLVRTSVRSVAGGKYQLSSLNGIEVGTWLQAVEESGSGQSFRVTVVTKTAVQLEPDPAWAPDVKLQSVEFNLSVQLLSDSVDGGKSSILASEVFSGLSLDRDHSRYAPKIVGAVKSSDGPKDVLNNLLRRLDGRTRGESQLIRLDLVTDNAANMRIVPGTVWTNLVGGSSPDVAHTDVIGTDDIEPALRTGLHTLRNEDDISLVACPGWTDQAVQQALLEHCELMKYRFAVLDAGGPPNDDLGSVRDHRSRYDSKYAAIYHPWVQIPNPSRGATGPSEVACPPSGHVMGLIADVDVRRGVHKAPANEVLRGVVGLQRKLQKAEQELLNPFPSNLNVIRDFRDENRGIRVWGARVISSDPDWKYINVRRLFNFVEKSVERGLQWVVFEPNDEPLWARVRQSITGFLKSVWRDGALQGRTQEEAFYVVADRTTMTQQDIDTGRLIVEVGIAPVKPAEFVIIRIGMYTANAEN